VIQEFKDFVNKGNFVDIAVAFVIGAAFATVVAAFTERIVSPLIAMLGDTGDLAGLGTFGEDGAGSVGAFLEASINFLIVAFVMFLVVKAYNTFKERNADPAAPDEAADPEDIVLLREIRDALAARPVPAKKPAKRAKKS
jgi:large conductance mechanosensitive channel